jgi:ankyrin repeat protein
VANQTYIKKGRTVLHVSSAEGHVDFVLSILAKKEIPVSLQDTDGLTPLHWAAMKGKLEVHYRSI